MWRRRLRDQQHVRLQRRRRRRGIPYFAQPRHVHGEHSGCVLQHGWQLRRQLDPRRPRRQRNAKAPRSPTAATTCPSDASCAFGPTSLSNSTTIGTLTLAANGSSGPQTAAITTSSSAHGIVPPSACTQTTDERGQPRPGLGYSTACDAGAYEIQKSTGYDLAGSDGGVFVFPTGQIVGLLRLAAGPRHPREERRGPGADEQLHRLRPGRLRRRCLRLPDRAGLGLTTARCRASASRSTTSSGWCRRTTTTAMTSSAPTAASSSSRPARPAGFYGSLPGLGVKTNDIVGLVAEPGGGGYLLAGRTVASSPSARANYYGSLPGRQRRGEQHRRHRLDPRRQGLLPRVVQRHGVPLRRRRGPRHAAGHPHHGQQHREHRAHGRRGPATGSSARTVACSPSATPASSGRCPASTCT